MTGKGLANPAIEKFVSAIGDALALAQVVIARTAAGFELRQIDDRGLPADQLRTVPVSELRGLAQKTATGAFRPLKSSPNLQRGWRADVSGPVELEAALRDLYPGAVADWFAVHAGIPYVTDYRPFTERQSGMYRVTATLTDTEAAQVVRACCPKQFCLKQRLWTVPGLTPDSVDAKSLIPCLEPCAVFLELARTAARINQAGRISISSEDAAIALASLQASLGHPDHNEVREADCASPRNPRRMQLAMERLSAPPQSQ